MTATRLASIVTLLFVTGGAGSASAMPAEAAPGPAGPGEQASSTRGVRLEGTVTDAAGTAVGGALVSIAGDIAAVVVTDGSGRYVFQGIPAGPYLLRVHQRGFQPASATLIQVLAGSVVAPTIRLRRLGAARLLTAGAGGDEALPQAGGGEHDHGELAWKLRHARRGALDDVAVAAMPIRQDDAPGADGVDLPLSGQFNLLTSASFDEPEDLFLDRVAPNGLAYLTLSSAAPGGTWRMRGTLTQGDLSAWMGAASYVRSASAAHAYETGASFARQRYDGGNAAALAAIGDGARTAGSLYAFDHWRLGRARVSYGGRYDRYDYLSDRGLWSSSAAVRLDAGRGLRLHGAMSSVSRAPGAEEFALPEAFGFSVTPARTFSPVAATGMFRPEHIRQFEAGADQDLDDALTLTARVFAQRVDDQMVALFGVDRPGASLTRTGHYFVGATGDYDATGFGVGVRRTLGAYVSGAVDYSLSRADWTSAGADRLAAGAITAGAVRAARERIGDLRTSINAEIPMTATRVIVVYRVLQATPLDDGRTTLTTTRFDVQVHQTLPFLRFTNAQWAALVALQNQVRDSTFDQSVYDELLAIQAPTRLVGGLTVRF